MPSATRQNYVNNLDMWNVRRIAKREEVVDVFRKGKFELLTLIEAKLKGNGEVSCCGGNGIIAGVQEIKRVREGMGVLMNNVCGTVL